MTPDDRDALSFAAFCVTVGLLCFVGLVRAVFYLCK